MDKSNKKIILLSGDRHYSDRSRRNIGSKMVYEFMSSGLNKPGSPLPSKYRFDEAVDTPNYATIEIYKEENTNYLKLLHNIKSSEDGAVISSFETIL